MSGALETGFAVDRRWRLLRGEMEQSKKPDLLLLARILAETGTPYAVIGGVAVEYHQDEPRGTLDIDLAVAAADRIPRDALKDAGFAPTGVHAHSENWVAPGGTPIQFTDDPALTDAVGRAESAEVEGVPLRILRAFDLVRSKLRAAGDPARRPSKRLRDLSDAQALIERDPALETRLDPDERALLDRLRR